MKINEWNIGDQALFEQKILYMKIKVSNDRELDAKQENKWNAICAKHELFVPVSGVDCNLCHMKLVAGQTSRGLRIQAIPQVKYEPRFRKDLSESFCWAVIFLVAYPQQFEFPALFELLSENSFMKSEKWLKTPYLKYFF